MLFYLGKHKKKHSKKFFFLGDCQYQNKKALLTDPIFSEGFVLPTEILPSPPLIRYIRAKYLWSNEWWFLLALSASSRQKLRGIFLQFVSAVGGAGAVGMLTEYSTLPHFKNLARYILPQHTVSSSKKDILSIFFYHKQSCSIHVETIVLTVIRGMLWSNKGLICSLVPILLYFVGPKHPSGNC